MNRKHSIDFKLNMNHECLNSNLGYRILSAKHEINTKSLKTWVNQFKQNGVRG